jgi:hypothetical protein
MRNDDTTENHPRTLSVPEVGRKYFGIGRGASYAAAARGDIPTIRLGRLLRAPVVAVERMLAEAGQAALTRHESASDAKPPPRSGTGV